MGVYIKDMGMPKTCFECFNLEGCKYIPRWFTTEQAEEFCKGRPKRCLLIEIDLVRCEECKHWHKNDELTYCDKNDYGYGYKANDFCSYGERRTDE